MANKDQSGDNPRSAKGSKAAAKEKTGAVETDAPKVSDDPSYDYEGRVDGDKESVAVRDPSLDDVGGGSLAADNSSHYDGVLAGDDPKKDPPGARSEELDLGEDDERLPWLESRDYDDDDDRVDGARLAGLVLFGLLALALLLGLIWWFSRPSEDKELAGDGSTIAAPDGDYKERPEAPGGKTFEGTGDSSFAVGEGQSREGRVGEGADGGNGGSAAGAAGSGSGAAAGSGAAGSSNASGSGSASGASGSGANGSASGSVSGSAGAGGVGVQVGAYSTRPTAEAGWVKITKQTDKLNGVSYRIVEGNADIGKVYRVQAVTKDAASAKRLCDALKADGVACQVKR